MDKILLVEKIVNVLHVSHENAVAAAMRAYDTATNNENIAENKYDTLALEASYLAHGQAQRVAECEADIAAFKNLQLQDSQAKQTVRLGALVELIDDNDQHQFVFLGPAAGGVKISFEEQEVTLVTLSSPLGKALINGEVDDEVKVSIGDRLINYEIVMIS